jgi:hypothetical protein
MSEDNPKEVEAEPQKLEMSSYEISATRVFEADFSVEQLQTLMQRTGAESPDEAIELAFLNKEKQNVRPEQKLLAVDVQANETPDN